jgi:hypothetical protein
MSVQVIEHEWSRRLNQDIARRVPQPGEDPAHSANPCWDWLHASAQNDVQEAQIAFHGSVEGVRPDGTVVDHGWSLPYPYDTVKQVMHA